MRAYLSFSESGIRQFFENAAPVSFFPDDKVFSDAASDAYDEARRILTDVEDEWTWQPTDVGSCGVCDGRVIVGRICFNDYGQCIYECTCHYEHDALAESLTAFLAAPDPAAYLRSKQ